MVFWVVRESSAVNVELMEIKGRAVRVEGNGHGKMVPFFFFLILKKKKKKLLLIIN